MQNLRMGQAISFLQQHRSPTNQNQPFSSWSPPERDQSARNFLRILARSVYALQSGVSRAHLLPAVKGTLLKVNVIDRRCVLLVQLYVSMNSLEIV